MSRPSIVNPLSELNRRRDADLQSRRLATTILAPEGVSGKSSAAKLLTTTLGGVLRPITDADLRAFRKSAQALAGKLREGLTAQEIIDQSRPADRDRARREINVSIPTRLRNGEVLFTTSAGPASRVSRHFVTVVWPGYGAALSTPGTPLQAAAVLAKAPLKFDCDCPHHRYRFRYIVTAMGANAGRAETGYPKLTNPTLTGVACKHVLRTMVELQNSAITRRMVAKTIDADRLRIDQPGKTKPRVITATRTEADRIVQGRKRAIYSSDERERRQAITAIRKALPPRRGGGSISRDIQQALTDLTSRKDVTAGTILKALQAVLNQPTGSSK